jgi:hypothetical protein
MENSVSFTMADDVTRDLVVVLQSISYSGSTTTTLLSSAIDIFVDSTDPNIWLPGDACDAFEAAFGLTLDNTTGLYLVNETHRNTLLDSNAEVSFMLSDVESGGDTVSITLPYAAFDLTAEYPLVDNTSYYFPLKRANNSTQYTLGRTFLQEAYVSSRAYIHYYEVALTLSSYLSADYERQVFNVSACVWNEGAVENIITITSNDSSTATGGGGEGGGSGSGNATSSKSAHLGSGAIAGIVVGCVVTGILTIGALALLILRKRRKWMKAGYAVAAPKIEPDKSVLDGPVFNSAPAATDTSTPFSADDISAPRPTAEYSRSATDSLAVSGAIGSHATGESTPELDGRHIPLNTKLDGREITAGSAYLVVQNPAVYELHGSEVEGKISRVGELPSFGERQEGNDSPPSPDVSTVGINSAVDKREHSALVSPMTPVQRGSRLF